MFKTFLPISFEWCYFQNYTFYKHDILPFLRDTKLKFLEGGKINLINCVEALYSKKLTQLFREKYALKIFFDPISKKINSAEIVAI